MAQDDWDHGYQAAKAQAAGLARLRSKELDAISSESFQLDPGRHKSRVGMVAAVKQLTSEILARDTATYIAYSIEAMQPLETLSIEKIATGFPTDGDCPEYGALSIAEEEDDDDDDDDFKGEL
jgi:hypothetical protein